MPNIGNNNIPSAIGPGPCDPLFAACELLVWMVRLTVLVALPTVIVAGEKVAVAPGGNPVTVNVTGPGNVDRYAGTTVKL
jgi:hypothetical protein